MEKKLNILYISSVNPLSGSGTGTLNMVRLLKSAGVSVDFLTLYPVDNNPDIMYVQKLPAVFQQIVRKIKNIKKRLTIGKVGVMDKY